MNQNENDVLKETSTAEVAEKPEQDREKLANNKGKKKWIIPLVISLVVIAALAVGGIFYFNISKNPTDVLKAVINNAYEDFSKELKKYDKNKIDFDIVEDSMKADGELELGGSLFKGLESDTLSFSYGLDYANKKAYASALLNENNKKLVDGSVYLQNDKTYLTSDSLFDNVYELSDAKFDEAFDLEELKNIKTPSVDDIDYVVKEFKDALIDSLDEKQMTQSKETIEINDKSINTTKITYTINEESAKDLSTKMADIILANDKLITKLAEMYNVENDFMKESIEELKNEDNYADFGEGGEFVVYTTGVTNKAVGCELNIDGINISIKEYKDNAYIEIYDEENENRIIITSIKEKDIYNVVINYNDEEVGTLNIKEANENTIDLDYDIDYEGIILNGSLKLSIENKNNDEYSYDIEFDIDYDILGQKNDFSIKLSMNINFKEDIDSVNTSKAISFDKMTEADANKMADKLAEIQNSKLFEYIGGLDLGLY